MLSYTSLGMWNVVCEMASILSLPQCVNSYITEPADDLVPNTAKPAAGTVLITGQNMFLKFLELLKKWIMFLLIKWHSLHNMKWNCWKDLGSYYNEGLSVTLEWKSDHVYCFRTITDIMSESCHCKWPLTRLPWTICPPFHRRNFQMHLLEWKC